MKRTAANSALLTVIKRQYNAKIYKRALGIYNSEGRDATLTYLQQFSTVPIAERLIASTNEELQRRANERGRRFRQ